MSERFRGQDAATVAMQRAGLTLGVKKDQTPGGRLWWVGVVRKGRTVLAACWHQHETRKGNGWHASAEECISGLVLEATDENAAQDRRRAIRDATLRNLAIREDARAGYADRAVAHYDERLAGLRTILRAEGVTSNELWDGRADRLLVEALYRLRTGADDPLPMISAAEMALRIGMGEVPQEEMSGYPFPGEVVDGEAHCTCPPELRARDGYASTCPAHGSARQDSVTAAPQKGSR